MPATEEPVNRLPGTVLRRQIPPRGTGPNPPSHPVDQPPSAHRRPAQHRDRQQRTQHRPLIIGKIPSPHIEIITARSETRTPVLKHDLAEMNEAYTAAVGKPFPARTTVYMQLPPGVLVEVDALAALDD
ncbi:hypothetical protein GCM10009578_024860 [Streptomyces rhizosphaericus]